MSEKKIRLELFFSWKQEDMRLISICILDRDSKTKLPVKEKTLMEIEKMFKAEVFPIPNPEGVGYYFLPSAEQLPEEVQLLILEYEIHRAQSFWRI